MSQVGGPSGWRWWDRLLFWGAFPVGIALIALGTDTVDRAFGAAILAGPTVALCWAIWKILRGKRAARRDSRDAPPDDC